MIYGLSLALIDQKIEGDFMTRGGSVCQYKEVEATSEETTAAMMIECSCKNGKGQLFEYSCFYRGKATCLNQNEERTINFYDEIAEVFQSKCLKSIQYSTPPCFYIEQEDHACLLNEIDLGKHTTACMGQHALMKKVHANGDDPLLCNKPDEEEL